MLVATPDEYHAALAINAIEAGKHVVIEKPIALARIDALRIAEAAATRPDLTVCVGYMRRYATAMSIMKDLVATAGKINYVVVRDIIGANATFVEQSGTFPYKAGDFPAGSMEEKIALGKQMVETSIGKEAASNPTLARTWRLLNGLSSHDISALREIFGSPRGVRYASSSDQVTFLHAILEYDGFDCHFETGIDSVASFDASIEVFAQNKRIKLIYDTPYVKGLPVRIVVKEPDERGIYSERELRPTYVDPYTQQFLAVHESITKSVPIKTTPADAIEDLKVFEQIVIRLAESLASKRTMTNGHAHGPATGLTNGKNNAN